MCTDSSDLSAVDHIQSLSSRRLITAGMSVEEMNPKAVSPERKVGGLKDSTDTERPWWTS